MALQRDSTSFISSYTGTKQNFRLTKSIRIHYHATVVHRLVTWRKLTPLVIGFYLLLADSRLATSLIVEREQTLLLVSSKHLVSKSDKQRWHTQTHTQ